MRVLPNKEMLELRKIFEPYKEKNRYTLVDDAPEEAIQAFKKYDEIWDRLCKEEEQALLAYFDE